MDNLLPFFEDLDREQEAQAEATRQRHRQPTKCHFCGEYCRDAAWAQTNHGIVFNGWCLKALMWHTRFKDKPWTAEAGWLQSHGIDITKDRFDESHWNHDNVANHYSRHYGDCY